MPDDPINPPDPAPGGAQPQPANGGQRIVAQQPNDRRDGGPPPAEGGIPWRWQHTVSLIGLFLAMVAVGLSWPDFHLCLAARSWVTLALFVAFVAVAGHGVVGRWLGVLIDERNRMSLSRLQMVLWTIVVLSAFLTTALSNVRAVRSQQTADGENADRKTAVDAVAIAIPNELWLAMGISTVALLGSPLVLSKKKERPPDPQELERTALRMAPRAARAAAAAGEAPTVPHQGQLLINASVDDAQLSDLFETEETGNGGHLDLAKMQMFFFAAILLVVYAAALSAALGCDAAGEARWIDEFPKLSDSAIALLGISNGGYLLNKAVPHSQQP